MSSQASSNDSPRVFISYSHDSADHERQVMHLGNLLRGQLGIDAHLDEWYADSRRDWSQWAIEQFDRADFILAIASPAFRARADGRAPANEGRGAQFEGAMLRNKMTEDLGKWISRILPVVLPGNEIDDIPEFLLPYSATHYVIDRLTPDGIVELRRVLTNQPLYPLPPLAAHPVPLPLAERGGAYRSPDRPRNGDNSVRFKHSTVDTLVMGDYNHHGRRG